LRAAELLRALELRGERLTLEGDRLRLFPGQVEGELIERIRANRDELKRLVSLQELSKRDRGGELARIRAIFPLFGQTATVSDGWKGQVWGISPRGLMVRGLHSIIYHVDFADLIRIDPACGRFPKGGKNEIQPP
jgi:hypothetical protein